MDCGRNRTVGWVIGSGDAQPFQKLYDRLKDVVEKFYTDDWEVYNKIIPASQLVQGKKYTMGIEQSNSNVRHYLGRMTRRTKVVPKSVDMIDVSLKITCCLNEYGYYQIFQKKFLFIF